jgi:RHS repeat-associated protein
VWRWDQQEPFGVTVPDENPSGLGAFEFPLRFPGQYADKETNLHYNYFRDYDPAIGRYVEADLLGVVLSPHLMPTSRLNDLYAYASSDPQRRSDPQGLLSLPTTSKPSSNLCVVGANPDSNCYINCLTIGAATCGALTAFICVPVCLMTRNPFCWKFCPPVIFTPCMLQAREECKIQCGRND